MAKALRIIGRKLFDVFGINRSFAFQFIFGNAFKEQRKLIKKNSPVIFDVGAYDGRTAIKYRSYFKDAIIHSFEPFPASYKKLLSNKLSQQHTLNQFALSDEEGVSNFYVNNLKATNSLLSTSEYGISINKGTATENIITIQQKKIDTYCSEQQINYIDILKIDVQGAELKVLRGAEKMLSEKRIALIYFETEFQSLYNGQPLFEEISLYLKSKNYSFFSFYNFSYLSTGELVAADALFIK